MTARSRRDLIISEFRFLPKRIPHSSEARREWARKQRLQKKLAKRSVVGLGLVTVTLLGYALSVGL